MKSKVINKNKLKYMNDFPIIIMIVVAIIVIILSIMYLSIKPYGTIYTNGYMVLSGNMTYNLINDSDSDEELNIEVTSVSNGDYLYKQMDNYYVGVEKKIEVERNYPIYSSDGLTIYNLSEDVTLIDRKFEKLKGYPGLSLNYGILYNIDEEQPADDIDYLFMYLNNSVYINAQTMVIKTEMNEYTIPMHSPIYFDTNYINYYVFDGKHFVFNEIEDIYYDSIIKIGDVTLTYNEFLLQMELIKISEIVETPEEEVIEKPTEENKEEQKDEEKNETEIKYVKPSVSVTDFVANVYSASAELVIEDPAGVITSNPMFEIYTNDDKLYSRNRFSSSGIAKLTGLSSNSEYKIIGTYKYKNKEGVPLISTFYEGTIKTKDINSLEEIKLKSEQGEIYSDKIEIKDLHIINNKSEAVLGAKKIVLNVWEEDSDDIKEYKLSYGEIRKLMNGEKIVYRTPNSLKSKTIYKYLFKIYDESENELKVSGDISGTIKTSKRKPEVDLTSRVDTKRNEITINVKTRNPDEIHINDYKYQLFAETGELISEKKLDYSHSNTEELLFANLDYNSNYIIKISGIYNLEDGKGNQIIEEEKTFTTVNLKESFTAWYDARTLNVTYNSISADVYLGANLAALERSDTEIIVYLADENGNAILDNNGNLKHYNKHTKDVYSGASATSYHTKNVFEGLESNKEYKIKIRVSIKQFKEDIFIEKELNPSIITEIEQAYVLVNNKKLMGDTLSLNLTINDSFNLLSDELIIEIYEGKLNSENDIKGDVRHVYRKKEHIKENTNYNEDGPNTYYIDMNLTGYNKDEYTIFLSSKPYNNLDIKKYLSIGQNNKQEEIKTAINVDRNVKIKLEMYEQQKQQEERYTTTINVYPEMPNTEANVFLLDCVNDSCLNIGYIDNEKSFNGQNAFIKSSSEEGMITVSFRNKINDGNHRIYAVMEKRLALSTEINTNPVSEKDLLKKDNVYFLSTLDYSTKKPIINISNEETLLNICNVEKTNETPCDGYYAVTENLNLTGENRNTSNRNYTFSGIIDFQGYTLDLYKDENNTLTVFNTLGKNGQIKNAVFNYHLNYDGVIESLPGFISINNGSIENIIINVKQYEELARAQNIGLIAYTNNGEINNFIINLKSDIDTYGISSLVTNTNAAKAIIHNGYVTSEGNSKIILHDVKASHGTFAYTNNGTIKNIYNLVSVVTGQSGYSGSGIATIIRNNTATAKNCISVATVTQHSSNQSGPNIIANSGTVKNNYYVDDREDRFSYNGSNNEQLSLASLDNPNFLENVINEEDEFNIVQGYYPILKMNAFMDNQQKMRAIGFDYYGETKVAITQIEVEKGNKDGTAGRINVYVNNPDEFEITEILIEDLTTEKIPEVEYDENLQMSKIPFKLTVGENDIARSKYRIHSLKYKDKAGGLHEIIYRDKESREINVDMYRFIYSYNDFINSINKNENIYLKKDISPSENDGNEISEDALPLEQNYTAKMNGNEKTLDLSKLAIKDPITEKLTNEISRGYFLYGVSFGEIKNLKVTGMQINSGASYIGFIRYAGSSIVENIDISEKKYEDGTLIPSNIILNVIGTRETMYVGGLIGSSSQTSFKNISINNLNIKKADEYQGTIKNNIIGGIAGKIENGSIGNSYVYNLNADNIFEDIDEGTTYLGGIVGDAVTHIKNCYSKGKIETQYYAVGGIAGRQAGGTSLNNYSYMDISSTGDYLGGIIGLLSANITVNNNMFIGKLENNNSLAKVSKIAPSTNSNLNVSNYILSIDHQSYKNFKIIRDTKNLTDFDLNNYAFDEDKTIEDLPYLKSTSFVEQRIKNDKFERREFDFKYDIIYKTSLNEIVTVTSDPYKIATAESAKIVFRDLSNMEITPEEIISVNDDLTIKSENGEIILSPNGSYVDNYLIKIKFSNSIEATIKIKLPFYRKIETADDWNLISTITNENVILLDNITLNNNSLTGKKINNLLGNNKFIGREDSDEKINLENSDYLVPLNDSLIYDITGTMKDVIIKNIKVEKNDDNTGVGIIKQNNGKIIDSKFSNIYIKSNKNYVGIVATNRGVITLTSDSASTEANMKNIFVEGISYVGGLSGNNTTSLNPYKVNNINAEDVTVKGTSYVGGILGNSTFRVTDIELQNSKIIGSGSRIGGIIGSGHVNNSSISDSTIIISSITTNTYIGGIGGYTTDYTSIKDNVKNVKITADSEESKSSPTLDFVGGVYGYAYYFGRSTVENFVIGKNINIEDENWENVSYDAIKGNRIGGLCGLSVGVSYSKVDNFNVKAISSGNYIGGIAGYTTASQNKTTGNVVTNSEIYGSSNIGGIFGLYSDTTDSNQTVENNIVTNSIISASNQNAGGIIGYLENINTYSQNMKFTGNLALDVNAISGMNSGGLIGKIYQVPSSVNIFLKDSLFYNSSCDTCSIIGKIQKTDTGVPSGYGTSVVDEIYYEDFANKSNFKEYSVGKTTPSYRIGYPAQLDTFMSVLVQNGKTDLKYPNGDNSKFPIYERQDVYPELNDEELVAIPNYGSQENMAMMSYRMLRNRSLATSYNNPLTLDFDVYASGANKLNIEFSDIDDSVSFYYKVGDYVSNFIPIEKRTYTLTYDFKAPINIYVTNNSNYKEKTINPKDIAKTVSLIGDKTYYVYKNSLYGETKIITGNFKNLYGKEALISDGKIYNIMTKKEYDANIDYKIISEATPIYEITYKGNNIKTYYRYSIVNGETKDMQMFIKNGRLSSISNSLDNKRDMYIIDFYNDSEIQMLLKEDGKLYNVKQSINYPNDFKNLKIKELYTDFNSTGNIVALKYENGEVYTFDYRTGKLIFTNVFNEDVSIFEYIKEKMNNSSKTNVIENVKGYEKYTEIELLKNKIVNVSIDEAKDKLYNSNTSLNKNEEYIVVYNDVTQGYEIFKSSTLLNASMELESETDKIYKNYELINFYKTLGKGEKKNSVSGIILFTVSIISVLVSLVLLIKNKVNKKGEVK